jgi:GNAT superfamily N-acetyltransferase
MEPTHTVEPATPDEYACVIDYWVRNFRNSPWAGCIANDQYAIAARATARALISRGARAWVVRRSGRVAGFAVVEGTLLHYLYVKPNYRKVGVGGALRGFALRSGVKTYTHKTPAHSFLDRHFVWDPVPARIK